jgi:signal transduction histidine kinase
VRDNGAGIPADALSRVFELFNRGGKRSDGQSAGIGLAVGFVRLDPFVAS